jgi:hypothetical protein
MSLPIPPLPPPTGITTQINTLGTPPPPASRERQTRVCEAAVINWIDSTTISIPINPFTTPPNPWWRYRLTGPPHPLPTTTRLGHPWIEAVTGLKISANTATPPPAFANVTALTTWLSGQEHRGCLYLAAWIQFNTTTGLITATAVQQHIIDPGWTPFRATPWGPTLTYTRGELFPPAPTPTIIAGGVGFVSVDWQLGAAFVRLGAVPQVANAVLTNRDSPYLVFTNVVLRITAKQCSLVGGPVSLIAPNTAISCNYQFPTFDWYSTAPTGGLARVVTIPPVMSEINFINLGAKLNPIGP